MKKITDIVRELAAPVVVENGCTLWDVEYVREAGQWYLRLLIDKVGGVDILDCEAISRRVSDLLDEVDPIESSYVFEVASAGAERALKRPGDFERFMGSPVTLKTYKPRDGRKEFPGTLVGYDDGAVTLNGTSTLKVAQSGTVTLGGKLTLASTAALAFNFTDNATAPKLAITAASTIRLS